MKRKLSISSDEGVYKTPKRKNRKIAAQVIGAAFGYAAAGSVGAQIGYDTSGVLYDVKFPEKQNMGKVKSNVYNAQSQRMAMTTSNAQNSKLKSTKSVKVSKELREKVQKVIAGEEAYGAVYKRLGGAIGYIDPGVEATYKRNVAVASEPTSVQIMWPGSSFAIGSKVWFGGLSYNYGAVAADVTLTTDIARTFSYFNPLKILDAASVLFNQKTADVDWSITTNNMTNVTSSVGDLVPGTSSSPIAGSLKVRVINSYVNWRMKNVSGRSLTVTIYKCVPKLKFTQKMPLSILAEGYNVSIPTVRAAYNSNTYPNGTTSSAISGHPQFEPNQFDAFSNAYKYTTVKMVIKPGEECSHFMPGPKNYTLDYSKLYPQGVNQTGSFYKNTTVNCMVSVELDAVCRNEALARGTGQYQYKTASLYAQLINPLSIEVDECFKLACPTTTGFISKALAAGTVQMDNLKTKQVLYLNYNSLATTTDAYTTYNEEQPGTGLAKGFNN